MEGGDILDSLARVKFYHFCNRRACDRATTNQPTNCPRYRRSTTCVLSLVTTRARHTRGSRTLQTAAAPLSWIPQLMVQGSTKSMDGHRSSFCHQPPSLLQLLWMVTSTPTNIQRRIPKQRQGTQLRLFLLQVVLLHRSPTFPETDRKETKRHYRRRMAAI